MEHAQNKLRSVKPPDDPSEGEGERHISPAILHAAAAYYSPEQLAQMATRRTEIRKRWTMERIGEPTGGWDMHGPPGEALTSPAAHPLTVLPLPGTTAVKVCPTCKIALSDDAHGYVRDPNTFGAALPCPMCSPRVQALKAAKRLQQNLHGLFGGANIPDMAWDWSLETFPAEGDQIAKREALAFANQETVQRGLYLWGDPGHGKTSLAIGVLKEFLARGESGLYIRSSKYIRLLRQADLGIDTQVGNTLLDLAFSVTCLVLDDIAVEHPTEYVIRQFYDLVEERRITNGLYTVITSNKSIDEVEERWRPQGIAPGAFHEGIRVVERLRESWGELEVQGLNLRAAHYQEEEEA
jgi:DNA replication protein DnaC